MKKIIFIADFFKETVTGGAELHDDVVLQYFKREGAFHDQKRCIDLTEAYVDANIDKVWFIGNFVSMPGYIKQRFVDKCEYILYEHDHKYLASRNPSLFKDFVAPKSYICNLDFYQAAKKVVCLSKFQRSIYEKNLELQNLTNLHCSMWSDEDLDFIRTLEGVEKKNGIFAVISSNNPIKKTSSSINYCKMNNLSYELISSQNYHDFLSQLAQYEGLVFVPGAPESTPRIAIEAKMLNCKFISNKSLIGVAHEDYFHLNGNELIQKVRDLRDVACGHIMEIVQTL